MHYIFFLIPIIVILYSLFQETPLKLHLRSQNSTEYIKNSNDRLKTKTKNEDIRKLTRQCARWLIAAQQDDSPLIATLHLQYGMGYLWAIKDITTTHDFKMATGLDFLKFESHATEIQDQISKKIIEACPQFAGDIDRYLGSIAGEV